MLRSFFSLIVIAFILVFSFHSYAQPVLPDMGGATEKGINVLSWISQFDGVKSIAVQRSSDSAYNYSTIGYVKNIKKGRQAFIDGHPMPGNNWYRLYIAFNSDLNWTTNRFKLFVDSTALIEKRVLPPNDSLQGLAVKITIDTVAAKAFANTGTEGQTGDTLQNLIDKLVVSIPEPAEINSYTYVKSEYVFTNPFTGHVNMELPDIKQHQYAIRFFDQSNRQVLELAKVPESPLIIDKRNFQKKGLYKFELMRDKQKMETGYITIY